MIRRLVLAGVFALGVPAALVVATPAATAVAAVAGLALARPGGGARRAGRRLRRAAYAEAVAGSPATAAGCPRIPGSARYPPDRMSTMDTK
jgi:hypothetical protein